MVHVKLFGLLRLDTGLKELDAEADTVGALFPLLLAEARRADPETKITAADVDGVWLMSPVCGG